MEPLAKSQRPWLKICGLRDPEQAAAVASIGVDAIGVIAVPGSPRWLQPSERPALFERVQQTSSRCCGVLVVANPQAADLADLKAERGHQIVQLHGNESPQRCLELRQYLGDSVRLWKALRVRSQEDLQKVSLYSATVDAVLLDAWVPDQLGGTGHRIPVEWLQGFKASMPWWLAGGIMAERVQEVMQQLTTTQPDGFDASSGVERAPGEKDMQLVDQLARAVAAERHRF